MNALWARINDSPVETYGLVQAAIIAATSFGLGLSAQQFGAICLFTSVLLTWLTRKKVKALAAPQYPETDAGTGA